MKKKISFLLILLFIILLPFVYFKTYFLKKPIYGGIYKDYFFLYRSITHGCNFMSCNSSISILKGFSVNDFKYIGEGYVKAKNSVYYIDNGLKLIPKANPDKFIIVGFFGKDDKHVFLNGNIVNGISSDKIKEVFYVNGKKYNRYYKNDNEIYYFDAERYFNHGMKGGGRNLNLIEGVDIDTFKIIYSEDNYGGEDFAKDKNNVYFKADIVEGADPIHLENFHIIIKENLLLT